MDLLAQKLDMDPIDLRLKNAAAKGTKTHYGPTHNNIGFEAVLAALGPSAGSAQALNAAR